MADDSPWVAAGKDPEDVEAVMPIEGETGSPSRSPARASSASAASSSPSAASWLDRRDEAEGELVERSASEGGSNVDCHGDEGDSNGDSHHLFAAVSREQEVEAKEEKTNEEGSTSEALLRKRSREESGDRAESDVPRRCREPRGEEPESEGK
ncbi:unnamed protein product [Phytomonas sp. EM1]|nr:unnamed protein product [Phytomonas sp. EM1]|eukprot:CCW60783.1 unnamed protein product [Phytomonas sp. isolate EM1]